jgi:hypothetical protein
MTELTDLKICQRIAQIEGIQNQIEQADTQHPYIYSEELNAEYDPLTDDALCFKLMIKYNVSFWQNDGIFIFCAKVRNADFRVVRVKLPNLAICLAIIESKEGA